MRAFLLYSNLPVGGIAVCVVLGTYALLRLPVDPALLVLAFCGVFLVYQIERALHPASEDAYNQPERLAWVARHRRYVWISAALAAAGAVAVLPGLRPATVAVGGLLALCSGLYMLPLGPGGRRLKSVWYLKPVVISGAWALGGVVLPVLEAGVSLGGSVGVLVGYRFLFVLPNALLADWPDRAGDAQAGLCTAATRLGPVGLRRASAGALLTALGGGFIALLFFDASWVLAVDLVGVLVLLVVVLRPWPSSRWFYGFVLDGLVAWPGITAVVAGIAGG